MAEGQYQSWTSWGRTRSPKNLAGTQGGAVTVLANTNLLKGITATGTGYFTENQRYLHVLVEDATGTDTDPGAVTVFGYCHAFLRWVNLAESHYTAVDNDAPDAASIDVGSAASDAAPAAQVPSDREYRLYEIVGIDKVAFVQGTPANVNVFAACSTF